MKKQCVRCGVHIKDESKRLWCDKCRERVEEEFRGEVSRPYEYYFKHNLKRQRALDRKIEKDLFWQEGDFGSWKTLNRMLRWDSDWDFNS